MKNCLILLAFLTGPLAYSNVGNQQLNQINSALEEYSSTEAEINESFLIKEISLQDKVAEELAKSVSAELSAKDQFIRNTKNIKR